MKDINSEARNFLQSEAPQPKKHILIFKTNIETDADQSLIAAALNSLPGIYRWSVNMEDIDKVLRIEALDDITMLVKESLSNNGFTCEELTD